MIFVTGGTGFLGRHLLTQLLAEGHSLRVLTRDIQAPHLKKHPQIEYVQGDVRDASRIVPLVEGCDMIIHAAGLFKMWGDEELFLETNVVGTQNLIDAALKFKIKRFIYISTIAIIGTPPDSGIIDESYPPSPADPYQKSKLIAEQRLLKAVAENGLAALILRPGAFYGPYGEYAFNRLFFQDPLRGIIMQMDGGKYIIFPAYIEGVASAIVSALDKGGVGEIYHICDDWIRHDDAFDIVCEEAQIRRIRLNIPKFLGLGFSYFLEAISKLTRQEPFYPLNLRSYVFNYWRVSNEKARRDLGFQPTPFREGAKKTIDWYRSGMNEDE
ncbi:NAD(P)-dependent oxidoreductase [Anaerolineales bacterium]